MERKKGLFLIHLPPPVHGVSVINQWITSSKKINETIHIDAINLATARSIKDIGKQGLYKYLKLVKIYIKVIAKLLSNRYDFFYITLSPVGSAFIKDSLLVLLARLFSNPILIHLHGKGIAKNLNKKPRWILLYFNYVFKNSHIIHLAKTLLADIAPISSYKRTYVLNNGIPEVEVKVEKRSSKIIILHLSNLIETKGSLTLLKSINELSKLNIQNFEVHFVGNWDNLDFKKTFLDYIKNNNLKTYVRVLGPLYGQDKQLELAKSSIFVLPTYYPNECFPLTILEAFQAGLPVISTYEGAIPEIIQDGENGFLINAKDKISLAEKMKLLIESESMREEMKLKALESYTTKYTFSIFENNFLNIINKVTA